MRMFAIGDLHLSLAKPKEMDIFGEHWRNHFEKIKHDWAAKVCEDDVVLIPGDISWAMRLEDAQVDVDAIAELSGKKIMIRGNHDYWWGSMAKMKAALHGDTYIIQNNCMEVGDYVVCGTRGWTFPMDSAFSENDTKIFEREKIRLRLSLDCAKRTGKQIIVMMHFPPIFESYTHTDFAEILSEYHVQQVVFGHLHGEILRQINLRDVVLDGVKYNLVSADYLEFQLKQII